MEFSREVTIWSLDKLSTFSHLRGYPESNLAKKIMAKMLLEIAHPGLVAARLTGLGAQDAEAMTPGELEKVLCRFAGGEANPMQYLLELGINSAKFGGMPDFGELAEEFSHKFPLACPVPVKYYQAGESE